MATIRARLRVALDKDVASPVNQPVDEKLTPPAGVDDKISSLRHDLQDQIDVIRTKVSGVDSKIGDLADQQTRSTDLILARVNQVHSAPLIPSNGREPSAD